MKTRILYTILFSIFLLSTNAQTTSDALNFSQTFNGGTARFVSMGGAFGALGGDFSSLSVNPAGLGVYRSSEFTLTPSFKKRSVSSDYNGSNGKDSRSRLGFDNIGFVFSYKPNGDAEKGLINLNLAVGYNKTNDFFANSIAIGDNSVSSIMDYFAILANGYSIDDLGIPDPITEPTNNYNPYLDSNAPWEAIMAWNTYLINPTAGINDYEAALNGGDGVVQKNVVSNRGTTGEYIISLGANFSQKFYIGATVGLTNINYKSSTTFSEDAFNTNEPMSNGDQFYYSDYYQTFETTGNGYNLKVGAIYKPIEGLRLGLAFHTPTYYNLEDTYSYSISSTFKDGNSSTNTPNSRYEYNLETPLKVIGSAAYVFKDFGLLSIDIEHVDYASMRFRDGGDGYDYTTDNEIINNTYNSVNNIKIGGEVKVNNMYFRGGYAFYPSPYKKEFLNKNANRTMLSGGVGYREGNFFIDATYLYSMQKEKYIFYNLNDVNPVSTKMTEGKFLLTVGFKF
ncbi:MAG: hypothetical protein EHM93_05090 [Bacteroidales bacterium]|nr:MAG: hypothetical protein EHM93_05090 [Bacteroidales bacterium]